MDASKNNSVYVTEKIEQAGGTGNFLKYKVEFNETPKQITIDNSGMFELSETINLNNPDKMSFYDKIWMVSLLDANYDEVNINVYKYVSYWGLNAVIQIPKTHDKIKCNMIKVYGTHLMVSVTEWDVGVGVQSYKVYYYEQDVDGNWNLDISFTTDEMGSIGLFENRSVIYSKQEIKIYDYSGVWNLTDTITNNNITGTAETHAAIAISDNTIAVASQENALGKVYVYQLQAGTWTFSKEIEPVINIDYIKFGYDISLNTDDLLFCTSIKNGSTDSALYVYEYYGSDWHEVKWIQGIGEGDFVSVKDNLGITSDVNTSINYIYKDVFGEWQIKPLSGTSNSAGFNKCNIYNKNIGSIRVDSLVYFKFNESNTKNFIKTQDTIEPGTLGYIWDGLTLKKGYYGPTNNGMLDVMDFNLQQPSERAYLTPAKVFVTCTDTQESNIGYNKELNVTAYADGSIQSTETEDGMLSTGEFLIVFINGNYYDVEITNVTSVPNGGNYDYDITYNAIGAVPTKAYIKNKGIPQYPFYSYTTDFETVFPETACDCRVVSCTVVGDTDLNVEKLKVELYI